MRASIAALICEAGAFGVGLEFREGGVRGLQRVFCRFALGNPFGLRRACELEFGLGARADSYTSSWKPGKAPSALLPLKS